MNKIKAYTIIEILVVLLVSGLLISFSLSIYLNFEKLFIKIFSDSNTYNEIIFFHNKIKNDFDKAQYIKAESEEIVVLKQNSEIVSYYFNNNYLVINSNNIVDTLKVKVEDYKIDFLKENENLISEFYIEIKYNNIIIPLHVGKKYTQKFLFNLDHNN